MQTVVCVASLSSQRLRIELIKVRGKKNQQLDSHKEQGRRDGGLEHNTGSMCRAIANQIC